MIYLTQIVFVKEGKEEIFQQFEQFVIPLMEKYSGKLIYRIRPSKEAYILRGGEQPYEIHIISFESEESFEKYMNDENRVKYVHMKNESVKSILLIKGKAL